MRVLLIEDDQRLTTALGESLRSEGYAVDVAGTAEDGRWMATEVPYDTIVLDVGLPDGDGIELCAALRDRGRLGTHPRAHGPCRDPRSCAWARLQGPTTIWPSRSPSMSSSRGCVRLLRRGQVERPSILTVGSMRLDPATRRVSVDRQPLPITGRAFAILELLARRKGQLVTRAEIMEHVWDWAWDGVSNVIDVHVSALRAILARGPGAPLIETVRGAGFLLRAPGRPRERDPPRDDPDAPHHLVRLDLHAPHRGRRGRRVVAGRGQPARLDGGGAADPRHRRGRCAAPGPARPSIRWSPPSRASSRPWLIPPPVRSMPAPVRRRG